MKKICFCAAVAVFFLASATLSAVETETADTYEPTAIPLPARKKLPSFLTKKATETVKLAESSVFRYNHFETNVRQEDTDIYYYPKNNECGFSFDANKKRSLTFTKLGLNALKNAFETYETEFDAHTLEDKKSRTAKKYGSIYAHYKIANITGGTEFEPEIMCGYVFVDKAPYFIITIPETKSKNENPVDDERTKTSSPVKLLFNRNQLRSFFKATTPESIERALAPQEDNSNSNAE